MREKNLTNNGDDDGTDPFATSPMNIINSVTASLSMKTDADSPLRVSDGMRRGDVVRRN